jgi:hypothetical protein
MNRTAVLAGVASAAIVATVASADFASVVWTLNDNTITTSAFDPFFSAEKFAGTESVLGPTSSGGSGSLTSSTMTTIGGDASANGLTWYSTIATASYTVSVDWEFSTTDAADFDAAGWVLNGVFTKLAGSDGNGTVTFSVNAGDTYGFGTATADGQFGAATTVFTNFVPAPGAVGLLAMAGIVGSRRRR